MFILSFLRQRDPKLLQCLTNYSCLPPEQSPGQPDTEELIFRGADHMLLSLKLTPTRCFVLQDGGKDPEGLVALM